MYKIWYIPAMLKIALCVAIVISCFPALASNCGAAQDQDITCSGFLCSQTVTIEVCKGPYTAEQCVFDKTVACCGTNLASYENSGGCFLLASCTSLNASGVRNAFGPRLTVQGNRPSDAGAVASGIRLTLQDNRPSNAAAAGARNAEVRK